MSIKIHYIFDPLCGWCYACSPILARLNSRIGMDIELVLHPGLLFAEARDMEANYREHIIAADSHIAELSGVEFGAAYTDRVRNAAVLRYDSRPSTLAVMAANAISPRLAFKMLETIQISHYHLGEDVADINVLIKLATFLGIDVLKFIKAVDELEPRLMTTVIESHKLMDLVGGNGFPTLILEQDGEYHKLDHSRAYGKPDALIEMLAPLVVSLA